MDLSKLIDLLETLRSEHGGDIECTSFVKSGSTRLNKPFVQEDEDGKNKIFLGPEIWN